MMVKIFNIKVILFKMDSKIISSIDGTRLMPYQGLSHKLDNLLHSHEVNSFLRYEGESILIYKKGLFDNPTFLVFRIVEIFKMIQLDDENQQDDIRKFFLWLKEIFLPFLAKIEQFMVDVRTQVNNYLEERKAPTIETMIEDLSKHFAK
jgi:hypothetical protein